MDHVGDSPRHNCLDPRLYNVINSHVTPMKIDEDKDRQIIDKWLLEKGKFQLNSFYPVRKPRCEITISGATQAMKNCLDVVTQLSKTQEELRNNVETMSSQEWKQKTLEIGNMKDEFEKSMMLFEDNTILKGLKGMVVKRTKKRNNRRKNKAFKKQQATYKEIQTEKHKTINRWLESKKEEVERVKMEEKMKKDADCVLYEVTKKKSEARKQLSLISALVKLRTVRDSMAVQRGEKLSLEDRKAFGLVTEKLIRMWENSYQNYCKEEQCLKVMLEHNATNDTKAALSARKTRIVEDWETLIFGDKPQVTNSTFWALTSADRDLETFVAIRKSWDTFLSLESSGSAIPVGWVIPPVTPNENWAPYIKSD